MNDPGLDEPIQETSKDVEQERKDELDFRKEDEQAFLNPRYYCATIIQSPAGPWLIPLSIVGGGSLRQLFPYSPYVPRPMDLTTDD